MSYTYEQLEALTLIQLREMCRENGIAGMSKERKDDVIETLMNYYKKENDNSNGFEEEVESAFGEAKGVSGIFSTVLTNKNAPEGQRTTTTVRITCGADSDYFDVAGKSVAAVAALLKDAFNISDLTIGLVSGKKVTGDYILEDGDNLEFVKPAGDKG